MTKFSQEGLGKFSDADIDYSIAKDEMIFMLDCVKSSPSIADKVVKDLENLIRKIKELDKEK